MGGQSVPCMKARAEKEYHGRKTESKPVGPSQTFYSVVAHQLLMATIVSISAAEAMSKKFDLPQLRRCRKSSTFRFRAPAGILHKLLKRDSWESQNHVNATGEQSRVGTVAF